MAVRLKNPEYGYDDLTKLWKSYADDVRTEDEKFLEFINESH